jgi:hypothetical protein
MAGSADARVIFALELERAECEFLTGRPLRPLAGDQAAPRFK